jgi:hypothetical protein
MTRDRINAVARRQSVYFVVGDPLTGIASYVWQMWWSRRDFYLVPTYAPISGIKVSLHGANDEHSEPFYRIGRDHRALEKALEADGIVHAPARDVTFKGQIVQPGVRHVITMRWTPSLFKAGMPSGPRPQDIKPGRVAHVLAPPSRGFSTDIEIYICQDRPWWPNEAQARADNACIGPLGNQADEYLTALSIRRRKGVNAPPSSAWWPQPLNRADRVRGIGAAVDDKDVLWVVEQINSVRS